MQFTFKNDDQSTTPSKIVSWIIRFSGGVITNEQQASYVLLALAAIIFAWSISHLFFGYKQIQRPSDVARHEDIIHSHP